MNDHPTSRQIDEFVAGAASPAVAGHLRECPGCRAEAERLSHSLAIFRQSVHQWSLAQERLPSQSYPGQSHRRITLRRLGWTAALAACLIAGLTLPRHRDAAPADRPRPVSDAELLVRVDRELSELAPASLEPVALQTTDGKGSVVRK